MDLSIVSPVYDEEDNVPVLYEELKEVLDGLDKKYEIIFVDDGSTDNSYEKMREIAERDESFKIVKLRTNFGQSSALQAGFDTSKGDIVVSIDSDLQNDPKDIPKLLKKLEEGYDLVSGWRQERKDSLSKKFFSKIADWMRSVLLGTDLHDYGCTLKAYRKECLEEIELMGELHRYIPPLLRWRGFDITEVKVNHRERKQGETNYGTTRLFKGYMDMINVWFWQKFHGRPLHLFGGAGLLTGFLGLITGLIAVFWKALEGITFTSTPLPLVSIFLLITGMILFVVGLLSDILVKNYYSSQDRKPYSVEKVED